MTFYVYLIGSRDKKKTISYVGYTNNLKKRINLHNSSKGAKFTKGRKWKLIYYKSDIGNFGDDLNKWMWTLILGKKILNVNALSKTRLIAHYKF